jgi:SAM-dependent methyltransferase
VEHDDAIRNSAHERYAAGSEIWPTWDRWNSWKRDSISSFCQTVLEHFPADLAILNAGSGSHRYEWMPAHTVNLDRFAAQVYQLPNPVVGEVEHLPFADSTFDLVICVGSVINYASAMEAVMELARVLRPGGQLILHFETTDSAEHFGKPIWRRDVAPLRTFNNGEPDMIWVYSRGFIRRTLSRVQIEIQREVGFHIASAALLRLGCQPGLAARSALLDRGLKFLSAWSDDVILVGRKVAGKDGEASY